MGKWLLALGLKPLIALLILVAYYFFVVKGLRWVYPKLPKSRLVDFLFRERATRRPDYGPGHLTDPAAQRKPTLRARPVPPSTREPE